MVRPAGRGRGPLLLIDEGWSQTLYLALALERCGYAVTVLTAAAAQSRYHRGGVRWCTTAAIETPRFMACVAQLMEEEDFTHVLPLTEAAMRRLWREPGMLRRRLFPSLEDWQRPLLFDKHALLEHMAARGIAVPRQRRLAELEWPARRSEPGAGPVGGAEQRAERARAPAPQRLPFLEQLAAQLIDELGLPLVLKGATGEGGARVRIAESRSELMGALRRAAQLGGSWAAQEHVSGPTCLVGGLFHRGHALRLYAGEKLEQYPPRTGPAIRLRSCPDAALLQVGRRVLEELRWSGLASADFILRRDGVPVLLEVNPRPWGSIAGAADAGVDLFTPLAALLAGEEPAPDLRFAPDRECLIFPRYLLAPSYRSLAGLAQLVRDLAGFQGTGWRRPRGLLHQLVRLRAAQHRAPGF